jgi:hypothetical protein
MNDICIIIQGLTNENYLRQIKEAYKNSTIQLIFSTWKGEEKKYNKNDIVIFNDIPKEKGKQNVMLQQLSTYNGLLKAESLGFKYAIKIRSDAYFTNIEKFLKCNINLNKLNFIYFIDHFRMDIHKQFQYFYDFCQISTITKLLKMWNFQYEKCNYSEELTTKHILKTFKKNDVSIIGDYLTKDNDIYWINRDVSLFDLGPKGNWCIKNEKRKSYYLTHLTI